MRPTLHLELHDEVLCCVQGTVPHPSLHRLLAHPCADSGTTCCGLPKADFVLRWESFLHAPQAVLILAYEAWPICGDGLDVELRLTHAGVRHRLCGLFGLFSC